MRKLRFLILLTLIAFFLFGSMARPTQKVRASAVGHEKYYTVWDRCIIGPVYPWPVGEWYVDCDGNWTGWGLKPSDDPRCLEADITFGEPCNPD